MITFFEIVGYIILISGFLSVLLSVIISFVYGIESLDEETREYNELKRKYGEKHIKTRAFKILINLCGALLYIFLGTIACIIIFLILGFVITAIVQIF